MNMRDCPLLQLDTDSVKKQLVERKVMGLNETERLSNITLCS